MQFQSFPATFQPSELRKLRFEPYSKYPPCTKDIAFWLPPNYSQNDFFALVREVAG
jgi:phenylalanyl-tRNA synthetase alpha chain